MKARRLTAGRRIARAACALLAATLTACTVPTLTKGDASRYRAAGDRPANAPPGPLVGLAISGGGNRSALFASYVIELLGALEVTPSPAAPPASFLSTMGYISSVSGGSFAAAYFGMRNPTASPADFKAMTEGGELREPFASFFDGYHRAMNDDWRFAALVGLRGSSLTTSNAHRLADALDASFLHGATFKNLDDREQEGKSPYLIFNATHYDTGRRFVMTTIPQLQFCVNVEALIKDVLLPTHEALDAVRQCDPDDPLTPEAFDHVGIDKPFAIVSDQIRLSYAVAASGAFPAVIGPVAFRVTGEPHYFHIIDGGITDNSGVESLTQLFIGKLDRAERPRALILEIDGSMPFNADGTRLAHTRSPLASLAKDPSRLSDIQEVRASRYRSDLWAIARQYALGEGRKAAPSTSDLLSRIKIVRLKHTDLNVGPLQIDVPGYAAEHDHACHRHWGSAQEVQKAVKSVPTDYVLDDGCDVELMRIAACWSVLTHASAIVAWFNGDDPAVQRGQRVPPNILERVHARCKELDDLSAGLIELDRVQR